MTTTREMLCLLVKGGEIVSVRAAIVSADTKSGLYITHPTFGTTLVLHKATALSAAAYIARSIEANPSRPLAGNIFDYITPSLELEA